MFERSGKLLLRNGTGLTVFVFWMPISMPVATCKIRICWGLQDGSATQQQKPPLFHQETHLQSPLLCQFTGGWKTSQNMLIVRNYDQPQKGQLMVETPSCKHMGNIVTLQVIISPQIFRVFPTLQTSLFHKNTRITIPNTPWGWCMKT